MAPDYLPRISASQCDYPFTYLGVLYHSCAENMANVTAACEKWSCMEVNYTQAVCAANIGTIRRNRSCSANDFVYSHTFLCSVVRLSVCRLSHSCTLLKPFNRVACLLAGRLLRFNDIVLYVIKSVWVLREKSLGEGKLPQKPKHAIALLPPPGKCNSVFVFLLN